MKNTLKRLVARGLVPARLCFCLWTLVCVSMPFHPLAAEVFSFSDGNIPDSASTGEFLSEGVSADPVCDNSGTPVEELIERELMENGIDPEDTIPSYTDPAPSQEVYGWDPVYGEDSGGLSTADGSRDSESVLQSQDPLTDFQDQQANMSDSAGTFDPNGTWTDPGYANTDPGLTQADNDLDPMKTGTDTDPAQAGIVKDPEQAKVSGNETLQDFGKGDPQTPADPSTADYVTTPVPKPDFQVEKKAQVSSAHPGETVTYLIRIRNTGNVTLHSVLSTEKFLGAGVRAYFREQENVRLSESRTQALVSQLPPGQEITLTAYVVIPSDAQSQQLVNQVDVTTEETGERIITSDSVIPLVTPVPSGTGGSDSERGSVSAVVQNKNPGSATAPPRTGDDTPLAFWLLLAGAALTASVFLIMTKRNDR